MTDPFTLFEISWEIGNKVGGIHTVVSTKAKTLVERHGDAYVCIGPWTLLDPRRETTFEEEKGFDGFAESCRALGVPVRVGRWKVPGRPRMVQVDASGLNAKKDAIFERLWEEYRVDSLFGSWDYVEPALFGHAAGIVAERWWREFVAPVHGEAVAQFHEWLTGTGLLHLKSQLPSVGTVFTTHATVLGRALGATGQGIDAGLAGRTPEAAAEALGVRSKHSLESVCAREADVLTTVSDVTAREVETLLGRPARPVLVNGIDLDVLDAVAGPTSKADAMAALRRLASRFLGEDVGDALLVATSGRYEVHNKGLDVLVDALGRLNGQPGRRLAFFALVPAGASGVRREVLARLAEQGPPAGGPLGTCTHNLFDADKDPLTAAFAKAGLTNAPGTRVKVIHVAAYLSATDGLLNLPYEAVLRGAEVAVFPSFYEPWGYTPLESLAMGVPAVTTDLAGFGLWALAAGLRPADGVTVLGRGTRTDEEAAEDLSGLLSRFLAGDAQAWATSEACRRTAARLSWGQAIASYETAFRIARARAADRAMGAARAFPAAAEPATGGGPRFVPFEVTQALPGPLRGLERLARNFWWCWDPVAPGVFHDLAPEAWEACRHNPVTLLADVTAADLTEEAADPDLVGRVRDVVTRFDAYMAAGPVVVPRRVAPTPAGALSPAVRPAAAGAAAPSLDHPVAYVCAEFGIHGALPMYTGGLGILAGDHLKASSDMGLPMVGIGLFYRKGYLRQRVSVRGDQVPLAVENDPRDLAVQLARDGAGRPVRIEIDLPGTRVVLVAWRAMVGRVPLYLLDADHPDNRPEDRAITHHLYGGDQELRLRQEIVLGKGGVRLLAQLGVEPCAVHMNEGHAAFAPLERVSRLVHGAGLTFEEAQEVVRSTTVFTTHTPVPAGHDRFSEALTRRYFSDSAAWLGCPWERFFALGQAGKDHDFNMTYLGLRMSAVHNAVSRLHARVSRRLLGPFWPGLLLEEIPVGHVTNGVHLPTWTAPEVARLLGAEGRPVEGEDFADGAPSLPDEALWAVRRTLRRALLADVRDRLVRASRNRHESPGVIDRMVSGLTEDALLVGFGRRFAGYKRADLLLRDVQRLEGLVGSAGRPVRVLFAGKAHPGDQAGQDLLRRVVLSTRSEALIGRVFFLDDYDMALAERLVRGVDVWLNTPVRLQEASGTSGMKVACNGGLNLSIRDGWWDEAYDGSNGFAIGNGPIASTREIEDDLDAAALYALLEEQVVPLFFERDGSGVPARWLAKVRRSLATIPPRFDARRMVEEYRELAYAPLGSAALRLEAGDYAGAKDLAARHQRIRRAFGSLRILSHKIGSLEAVTAGSAVEATAEVDLAGLDPGEVAVELVFRGPGASATGAAGLLSQVAAVLGPVAGGTGSVRTFLGTATVAQAGRFSGAVRVRAKVAGLEDGALADLVVWA